MKHLAPLSRSGVLLSMVLWTGALLAAGPCLEVDAPGIVQLPDGQRFEARTVQLCQGKTFTPATSILEVRIDGVTVGQFLAEIRTEAPAPSPDTAFIVFDRRGAGSPFHLAAMTVCRGGRSESHRLWRIPGRQIADARRRLAPPTETTNLTELVLIPAKLDPFAPRSPSPLSK